MGEELNKISNHLKKRGLIITGIVIAISIIVAILHFSAIEELLYLSQVLRYGYVYAAPIIFLVFAIVLAIVIGVFYANAKGKRLSLDYSDPIVKKSIGREISKAQTLLSVLIIISFFFFGTILTMGFDFYVSDFVFFAIIAFLTMIGVMVFSAIMQKKLIDEIITIDDSKTDGIIDGNISKRWIDSCNETEQQIIFKSGYFAYRLTSKFCIFLWAVFVILGLMLDIGFWPVASVTAIWLFSTLCYIHQVRELTRE